MYCIETRNLTYRFSREEIALDDLNIQVPEGSVYGFLGPNGAGKTTTLKLMLGLLKKQEGEIFIFNRSFHENRVEVLKRTGSLVESPSLYGHLSAAENLKVLQKIYQCPGKRIAEVLDIVGLSHTGKKKAAKFSLGMKQRLGIAMALLHDPSLLILDEPTNGLDPNGIIEIRELLKQLNRDHKMTILISSHLLSEIEKVVTHTGIIHKGRIMFQGTLDELHLLQAQSSQVKFTTSDPARAASILLSNGFAPSQQHDHVTIPITGQASIANLNRQLVSSGIDVYGISTVKNDLESIFMDLVKS